MDALEQIKKVYEDGVATINGRDYEFKVMTFSERRAVFAYTSSINHLLQKGDYSFLNSDEFKKIEKIINRCVSFENESLSKINIFDKFPEDYILFISTALNVICYPFLKGSVGG